MYFNDNETVDGKLKTRKANAKGHKVTVEVKDLGSNAAEARQLMMLVPPNCVVCCQDSLPGVKDDKLPEQLTEAFIPNLQFDPVTDVWVHDIRLENLTRVDTMFNKFLKQLERKDPRDRANSGYRASIISRKLTITPSNSVFLA